MTFSVRIEPSGHELTVEAGESILDAALRQGFAFPYGCRNGLCGTCKGKVLQGQLDYVSEPKALSELERKAGYALFCRAAPAGDLVIEVREIGAAKDIVIKTMPCRVARMERVAHDVMRLFLKLPATERLQYLAGQYIDILLRDGRRRSYSLANAPHNDELLELHIRHVPGGAFTEQVFQQMKEKAILRLQGPYGSFFLREESVRPIVLMAGGTGFAPIKAMLEHAFAKEIARPMHLYWGVRALRDLYLHELPLAWAAQHSHVTYTPVLSDPLPEDQWSGRRGWVHEAVAQDYPDLSGHDVYASGPPAMVNAGREAFVARGLPLERYYSDAFVYAAD
jgi:CDP-4-dehydro-6-deoxyglucose reductase, E3